jgi:hypothetical protein
MENRWIPVPKLTVDSEVPNLYYMQQSEHLKIDDENLMPGGYWYMFMSKYKFSEFRRRMFEENYFPYTTIVGSSLNNSGEKIHYHDNLTLACRFDPKHIDSFYVVNQQTNVAKFFMTFQDSGLYIIEYILE